MNWSQLWNRFCNWFRLLGRRNHHYHIGQARRVLARLVEIRAAGAAEAQILAYLRKIDPTTFEEMILELAERAGCLVRRNTRYSGDGGIDGRFHLPGERRPWIVQAKRYRAAIRPQQSIERIVTLYVAARAGDQLNGADIVVAAEKAGLQFGDMGIFHRLVLGKKADGPVFSMANMVKPGTFDMARLDAVATPGISLFMTLPGPLPALDAWEMMLPTAQRLAELLGAQVLDEDRNALGRQRIAHVRDELRAWDREQERMQIRPGR